MFFDSDRPYDFSFLPAPEDLRDRVNSLFVLRTDEDVTTEIMPAYSAQLYVFLRGSGVMHFGCDEPNGNPPVFFVTTMLEASDFTLRGPVRCIGVSLSHLGWACLASLPVNEVHDQNLSPEKVFAPQAAARLSAIAENDPGEVDAVVNALCDFIRETSTELKPLHAKMVSETTDWLSSAFSPPLEELYDRIPLSKRQVQRLSKRYFGSPPAALLKRFRAVRAAILLSHPDLSEASREEVFSAYFDQSHLIKDIRRYSGRTPRLLDRGSLVGSTFNPEGHGEVAEPVRASLGKDSG